MIKNCNLLIPRPPEKCVQATGEVFIPQKRTSSTSKLEFSSLLWFILALLDRICIPNADPNPDPASQNENGSVRIRIRICNTAHLTGFFSGWLSRDKKNGLCIRFVVVVKLDLVFFLHKKSYLWSWT